MEQDFPYKSLHDYLSYVFKDKNPDENEIAEAKKQYWKAYNTRLKRSIRKKRREVTIALNREQWEILLKKRSTNQSLHTYIKELLVHHIENPAIKSVTIQDTTQIEQQLFIVTDYLEGIIYHRRLIDKDNITQLENLLHELKKLLEDKL